MIGMVVVWHSVYRPKVYLFYHQGYGEGFDDVVIQGDVDELKFVAFYTR